jgi:hypothetical protein
VGGKGDSGWQRVLCQVGTTDVSFITCPISCLRKEQALPLFGGGNVPSYNEMAVQDVKLIIKAIRFYANATSIINSQILMCFLTEGLMETLRYFRD